MPKGAAQERFALYLPPETLDELRGVQARTGTAIAELIRRGIDFYLLCHRKAVDLDALPPLRDEKGGAADTADTGDYLDPDYDALMDEIGRHGRR
jgi:hypothetical protein